ncbi:DUF3291 domain-containing protein, partial [Actinomadura kijaniata]|uniref:DUF3291 domain-containing protein n=1 Tax=Actinomadura kijaniata TaxID=46161 RepID=UPI003F1D7F4F
DAEALWDYVYRSGHLEVMRRRREWFRRHAEAHLVMWWVPAGHVPGLAEAAERLELLRAEGPSPRAFTFTSSYSAEEARAADRALADPAGASQASAGQSSSAAV